MADPVGHYHAVGSCLLWSSSPTLAGAVLAGAPTEAQLDQILSGFTAFRRLGPQFDLVLDGSRVSAVDPNSLAKLMQWIVAHREELTARVRLQVGVVDETITGVTLSGILPALGSTHTFEVVRRAADAFARLLGEEGAAVFEEIDRHALEAAGETDLLRALRAYLRKPGTKGDLETSARELGVSTRTLQRALQRDGTSFQEEARRARFAIAEAALRGSQDKVATIAARIGMSESALTKLVREETGLTPSQLRGAKT